MEEETFGLTTLDIGVATPYVDMETIKEDYVTFPELEDVQEGLDNAEWPALGDEASLADSGSDDEKAEKKRENAEKKEEKAKQKEEESLLYQAQCRELFHLKR